VFKGLTGVSFSAYLYPLNYSMAKHGSAESHQ